MALTCLPQDNSLVPRRVPLAVVEVELDKEALYSLSLMNKLNILIIVYITLYNFYIIRRITSCLANVIIIK